MLNNIDKKNPFKVPDNYFEDFHAGMMSKIAEEPKAKVIPLWKKVVPWASVAAVLGGVIISIGILTNNTNGDLTSNNNISDIVITNNTQTGYDEEDFYLFLEDEVNRDSYYNLMVYQ